VYAHRGNGEGGWGTASGTCRTEPLKNTKRQKKDLEKEKAGGEDAASSATALVASFGEVSSSAWRASGGEQPKIALSQ
jgi:hypothetical protein